MAFILFALLFPRDECVLIAMSLIDSKFTETEYRNFFPREDISRSYQRSLLRMCFIMTWENRGEHLARYIYGAAEFMVSFMLGNERLCHS